MAIPDQSQLATASAQPIAQPIAHVAVQGQLTVVIVQQQRRCCCSVPTDTTQSVKTSRWSSIAAIVIHALALVAFGIFLLSQWIASLIGIIMGSILLCFFDRCCYITAVVLFSVGIFFDIYSALFWVVNGVVSLAVLPAFGAVAFLIGGIAACVTVSDWHESGAPDARVIQNGPVQVVQHAPTPSINATVVQPNYSYPVASQGPLPTYSGTL